jgi:hypothetical protein
MIELWHAKCAGRDRRLPRLLYSEPTLAGNLMGSGAGSGTRRRALSTTLDLRTADRLAGPPEVSLSSLLVAA